MEWLEHRVELMERKLRFIDDLVDVVSRHALVALVMLSAVIPFSIGGVAVYNAWFFFTMLVMASLAMLVSTVVKSLKYCCVLAERISQAISGNRSLASELKFFIEIPSLVIYLLLLGYSLLFVFTAYGVIVIGLFQGRRPEISVISEISLPYTLLLLTPTVIPITLTLIYAAVLMIFRTKRSRSRA